MGEARKAEEISSPTGAFMDNTGCKELDIDEIMRRIQDEIARRRRNPAEGLSREPRVLLNEGASRSFAVQEAGLFRFVKKTQGLLRRLPFYSLIYTKAVKLKKFIPLYHEVITLRDFCNNDDEEFISTVYKMIARREPAPSDRDYYLERLRRGRMSKTEIIGRIRYSREGRGTHVKIPGLLPRFVLQWVYRASFLETVLRKLFHPK
jgi:Domain of unknown function (DUF4214)